MANLARERFRAPHETGSTHTVYSTVTVLTIVALVRTNEGPYQPQVLIKFPMLRSFPRDRYAAKTCLGGYVLHSTRYEYVPISRYTTISHVSNFKFVLLQNKPTASKYNTPSGISSSHQSVVCIIRACSHTGTCV